MIEAIETYRNVVYPWQCDGMGHMNTQFYASAFDAAGFGILNRIAPARSLTDRGLGWADVRQLIEYRHEVRSGAVIVIRSRLVALGRSSLTVLHSMVEDDGQTLLATSETKTVLFDLEQRKAVPIEGELRARVSAISGIGVGAGA